MSPDRAHGADEGYAVGELDAAWKAVEAVLPAGAWFDLFKRSPDFHDPDETRYCAEAYIQSYPGIGDMSAFGPTPADALRQLARALSQSEEHPTHE